MSRVRMWNHWCEIMRKEDRRLDMLRASKQKKGRVICAWCNKDMGEAETALDTHGCCLRCLKLALRELDERLCAYEQGREAGRQKGRG